MIIDFWSKNINIRPELVPIFEYLENIENEISQLLKNSPNTVRTNTIAIFAFMEVIFCIQNIFQFNLYDNNSIIKSAKNNLLQYINLYILNKNNEYYLNEIDRFKGIWKIDIQKLRNSLTHFYSLWWDKIWLLSDQYNIDEIIDLENKVRKQIKGGVYLLLRPIDLFELIKKANIIIFEQWNLSHLDDIDIFYIKIQNVINIVTNNAPILIKSKNLKL